MHRLGSIKRAQISTVLPRSFNGRWEGDRIGRWSLGAERSAGDRPGRRQRRTVLPCPRVGHTLHTVTADHRHDKKFRIMSMPPRAVRRTRTERFVTPNTFRVGVAKRSAAVADNAVARRRSVYRSTTLSRASVLRVSFLRRVLDGIESSSSSSS